MKTREVAVLTFMVGLGSLQMAADVLGMTRTKAVAAATQVAPAMKVFTAHKGYETHAARFSLHWVDASGAPQSLALTPQTYASVQGPYNRRNVYGAAFAYGPLLQADDATRAMHDSVMRYALCRPGVLRKELGLPEAVAITARVTPVREPANRNPQLEWEIDCNE